MTETIDAYGALSGDALTIQRLLPGPAERIWAYLVDGEKRRLWLAAGEMPGAVGGAFTLTWRNDELTDPPGERPADFGPEHAMQSRVLAFDPPHLLAFSWGETGEVRITLAPAGERVLLTLTHLRVPEGPARRMIGAGWHAHLDVLAAKAEGLSPPPFWPRWLALHEEYAARFSS